MVTSSAGPSGGRIGTCEGKPVGALCAPSDAAVGGRAEPHRESLGRAWDSGLR